MADALILEPIRGVHLVLGAAIVPTVTQEPALVEVWLGYASDPYGTARQVGTVQVGQTFVMDHNPDIDDDLRVYLVSRGVDGAADCSQLRGAVSEFIPIQRETDAPTIGIYTDATQFLVVVGVDGFTRFARLRKVEVSDLEDFDDPDAVIQTTVYDGANEINRELPRFVNVTRESGDDVLTKYVRVSHSSGGSYGTTSDVLEIIFPDVDGVGGSTGGYDPIPHGHLPLEL